MVRVAFRTAPSFPGRGLTEDSPELSILLLRGAGSGTLKGVPIIDLMASGEAERVTELLSSSAALDAPVDGTPQPYVANVFNTQLQDSCGSKFSTEVFHVRYKKLGLAMPGALGIWVAAIPCLGRGLSSTNKAFPLPC